MDIQYNSINTYSVLIDPLMYRNSDGTVLRLGSIGCSKVNENKFQFMIYGLNTSDTIKGICYDTTGY